MISEINTMPAFSSKAITFIHSPPLPIRATVPSRPLYQHHALFSTRRVTRRRPWAKPLPHHSSASAPEAGSTLLFIVVPLVVVTLGFGAFKVYKGWYAAALAQVRDKDLRTNPDPTHDRKSTLQRGAKNERGYEPLAPRTSNFRYLELHGGNEGDPIVCSLHYGFWQSPPQYEALSYVWSNPVIRTTAGEVSPDGAKSETLLAKAEADRDSMNQALCDGKRIEIGRNLRDALRAIRYSGKSRMIWVDALCIDQGSNEEKSQQVGMMSQIYARATKVIIWLGSDPAIEKALVSLTENDGDSYQHWKHILNATWFRRVWCIQELANARKTVVQSGSSQVSWDRFIAKIHTAKRNALFRHDLEDGHMLALGNILYLDKVRKLYQAGLNTARDEWKVWKPEGELSLLTLLCLTKHFDATDKRDKLFALVGLASDARSSDWEIMPDYRLSVEEVYHRFALWHTTRKRQLGVLSFGADRNSVSKEPGLQRLPSWVPDLTRPDNTTQLPKLDYLSDNYVDLSWDLWKEAQDRARFAATRHEIFHADSRDAQGIFRSERRSFEAPGITLTEGATVLHVTGFQICNVQEVGVPLEEYKESNSSKNNLANTSAATTDTAAEAWMIDCWDMVSNARVGGKNEINCPDVEAVSLTMVCGMTEQGKIPPSDIFQPVSQEVFEMYKGKRLGEAGTVAMGTGKAVSSTVSDKPDLASNAPSETTGESMVHSIVPWMREWQRSRRFAITDSKRKTHQFATVPSATRPGDIICILNGGRVPYVLRPSGEYVYELVGECYVHGLMHGHIRKFRFDREEWPKRVFSIK
jgi:hypothetical protein